MKLFQQVPTKPLGKGYKQSQFTQSSDMTTEEDTDAKLLTFFC